MCRRLPWSILIPLAAACFATGAGAAPADYAIDPVHTRIAFRVGHAGFSRALGTFAGASGTLRFDADDWSTAKLEIAVPVASLDLGDDGWNGKVLDGTFFDAGKLPQARFASTAVEKVDDTKLRVRGDLTIHGVTRPVAFEATFNALKRHPLTFRRTAGFSAVLEVSRKDFGMDAWKSVIDDRVEIRVELQATRARGANDDDKEAPAHERERVDPPRSVPADTDDKAGAAGDDDAAGA
jgi:polyisoprenoid-binding protein YceI